jgi:hypothetical protein
MVFLLGRSKLGLILSEDRILNFDRPSQYYFSRANITYFSEDWIENLELLFPSQHYDTYFSEDWIENLEFC